MSPKWFWFIGHGVLFFKCALVSKQMKLRCLKFDSPQDGFPREQLYLCSGGYNG